MHKIFGAKENAAYTDRAGAYLIALRDDRIALVRTPKGYFLPGGGKEANESDAACIQRECLEETGCSATVREFLCSAETYCTHPAVGYFHPMQNYCIGVLTEQVAAPTEKDHTLEWIPCDQAQNILYVEMQRWAVGVFINRFHNK